MMQVRAAVVGFLMLTAAPASAGEPLVIKVSPNVAFAPANLVVRTTVEANASNRAIAVEAESGQFYRSSERPLDGDKAPRTTTVEFRSLPSGTYQVTVTLYDGEGKTRALARSEVNVMANGGR
jgi:hypothetical protein